VKELLKPLSCQKIHSLKLGFGKIPMPIYEYRAVHKTTCQYCANGFEVLQKLADLPLAACPECQQDIRRIISAPNLGTADTSLQRSNLEKHGFTRYQKSEKGVYEKTAGVGPKILKDE
jgi:putative FmdB family regulatory protein